MISCKWWLMLRSGRCVYFLFGMSCISILMGFPRGSFHLSHLIIIRRRGFSGLLCYMLCTSNLLSLSSSFCLLLHNHLECRHNKVEPPQTVNSQQQPLPYNSHFSGPSCSKLKIYIEWYINMLKFFAEKMWEAFVVQKLLTFFQQKNIRILSIESTKTVNEITLNELVKLTMLWTTGPRFLKVFYYIFTSLQQPSCITTSFVTSHRWLL